MDLNLGDTQLIIKTCKDHGLLRNQVAYVLATAYHETAYTMKPIHEYGGQTYLQSKPYYPFYGRGYVQLTWEHNYKKAGEKLGQDFIAHPEWLLEPQYAAPILVIGMVEGWFTGKKLADYIDLNRSDFIDARHIINGNDRAQVIASYANTYDHLLIDVDYGKDMPTIAPTVVPQSIPIVPATVQPEKPVAPVAPLPAPVKPYVPTPWWKALIDLFFLIFSKK